MGATDQLAPNGRVPKGLNSRGRTDRVLNGPTARKRRDLNARTDQIALTGRVQISHARISPVPTGQIDRTGQTARIVLTAHVPTDLSVQIARTDRMGLVPTDRIGQTVQIGPTDQTVRISRTGPTAQTDPIGRTGRTVPGGTTTATVTVITGSSVVGSIASNGGATGIRTATATGGGTTGGSGATVA